MPKSKGPANAGLLKQAPTSTHVALAEFITDTTGEAVGAETVALVQRAYPLYLKSPAVEAQKAAEKAEKERQAAERAAKRAAEIRARLEKIEAERAKILAQLDKAEDEVDFVPPVPPTKVDPEITTKVVVDDGDPDEDAEVEVTVADDEFVQADEDADDEFDAEEGSDDEDDF